MKAKEIWVEKKFNGPKPFENCTVGILVALGPKETIEEIIPQLLLKVEEYRPVDIVDRNITAKGFTAKDENPGIKKTPIEEDGLPWESPIGSAHVKTKKETPDRVMDRRLAKTVQDAIDGSDMMVLGDIRIHTKCSYKGMTVRHIVNETDRDKLCNILDNKLDYFTWAEGAALKHFYLATVEGLT